MGMLLFGAFSSSTNYNLNSYSIGPAGTSNSSSTTYHAQVNGGGVSGTESSPNNTAGTGGVQTEQLAIPQAPTVSNGSNTYYDQLLVTLNDYENVPNTSTYPSDVQFAVEVSTSSTFASGNLYLQTGGILGASPVYQSYTAWGGTSGTPIVGLASSTTYYVRVAAMQGLFTNTEFGAAASAATVSPSITYSVSPNSLSLGNLLPGAIVTSGAISFSLTTNGVYGASIFAAGQNGGLFSAANGATITALSGNLSSSTHGFGLQGLTASQSAGGPLAIDSPYNVSGTNVGTETTTYTPVFTTPTAITSGSATLDVLAKAASSDPPSTDYQEVLNFVAAASY